MGRRRGGGGAFLFPEAQALAIFFSDKLSAFGAIGPEA